MVHLSKWIFKPQIKMTKSGCRNSMCPAFIPSSTVIWKRWKRPNGWAGLERVCRPNGLSRCCPTASIGTLVRVGVVKIAKKEFHLLKMCLQSAVKGGPDDVEHLQPRMDISFWNLVPCYSIHTEPGLCLSTAICAAIGGTPSGSCMHRMSMTKTCCIINSKNLNIPPCLKF